MIVPSENLKSFIDSFESRTSFCEKFSIDTATLSRYLDGEISCSAKFIEAIKGAGFDFEKAFNVEPEKTKRKGDK